MKRLLVYSNLDASIEGVLFTEDFESDSEDLIPFGCEVDSDTEIDDREFPSGFPFEYNLERADY